ncbi:MAG TPA: MFS transporter [Dehalococcoidia bacterium]|nr:MFS transporter [Dehalococcoidia bacterium]HIL32575.1 MFS transporter [Dehalococcoidia bacterium]
MACNAPSSNQPDKLNLVTNIGRAAAPISILKQRNFGLIWSAMTVSQMGSQMETVVVVWYVLNLTDSPLLVGLTATARLGFNFLALFAGATADIVPRRTLMIIVQAVLASLAALMLVLIATDLIEVWHIFVITLLAGLARIFQMPTAQSLAVDSVVPERIPNAVALISAAMNLALIIGPILGGLLFDVFGPEGAYVMVASVYVLSGSLTFLIGETRVTIANKGESVFSLVAEGLHYVKGNQLLWSALFVAVIFNITGFSFHTTLVPIFAKDVLGQDSFGLGILISTFGIGGLVGSMFWASIPNVKHTGIFCFLAVIGWHSTMIVFAASTNFYLSVGILAVTGMMFSSSLVLVLTVLMKTGLPEFRGRLMGLRTLAIYAHAFGSLGAGAIAGVWGAPSAAVLSGIFGISMMLGLALLAPKLRRF